MNVMCGIETWDGLSALVIFGVRFPGALPRAGIVSGHWPSERASVQIPLPPLSEQERIVAELDAEAARMEAVRGLIPAFEAKIQRVLARVWGTADVTQTAPSD